MTDMTDMTHMTDMTDTANNSAPEDSPASAEFYVGYFAVPAGLRRFLTIAVPIVALVLLATGVIVASTQPSPGDAVWEQREQAFVGTLVDSPYPMLLADDAGDGKPAFVLLVRSGKHGARGIAREFAGERVRARGTLLHRDRRRLLELSEDNPVEQVSGPPLVIEPPVLLEEVSLKGEIIDPKCFLGAMKPGEGKTHKACATLCITGGIPPMFVTRDANGKITYYLLEDADGGPLPREAYPYIADPVEIRADLLRWYGLPVLRVSKITRL